MIFGILLLLLGLLGLAGTLTTLVSLSSPSAANNPAWKAMHADPTIHAYTKISVVPGVLTTLGQVIAGIGLIRAREWGRKLAIGLALYAIPASLVGTYMSIFHIVPVLAPALTDMASGSEAAKVAQYGMIGSAAIGAVFAIAFNATVAYMLMRAKVRVFCMAASAKPGPLIAG